MKKIMISFILGIIICSGIVYASSYLASDISYTPLNNNWNVGSVSEALDSLYDITTLGDATADNISEGKTAVVNGKMITGTGADNNSYYNLGLENSEKTYTVFTQWVAQYTSGNYILVQIKDSEDNIVYSKSVDPKNSSGYLLGSTSGTFTN